MSGIEVALSTQASVCLEKLQGLNLKPIAAYLMNTQNGYGFPQLQVFRAIRQYKIFLFVSYLYPQVLLVPTQEIDLVWHCHILHTRKYREDCQRLFGYFIDHVPESEVWSEANPPNWDLAFRQTQALLALFDGYFESPHINIRENEGRPDNLHLQPSACGRPNLRG